MQHSHNMSGVFPQTLGRNHADEEITVEENRRMFCSSDEREVWTLLKWLRVRSSVARATAVHFIVAWCHYRKLGEPLLMNEGIAPKLIWCFLSRPSKESFTGSYDDMTPDLSHTIRVASMIVEGGMVLLGLCLLLMPLHERLKKCLDRLPIHVKKCLYRLPIMTEGPMLVCEEAINNHGDLPAELFFVILVLTVYLPTMDSNLHSLVEAMQDQEQSEHGSDPEAPVAHDASSDSDKLTERDLRVKEEELARARNDEAERATAALVAFNSQQLCLRCSARASEAAPFEMTTGTSPSTSLGQASSDSATQTAPLEAAEGQPPCLAGLVCYGKRKMLRTI